jgi:hypothetical protein
MKGPAVCQAGGYFDTERNDSFDNKDSAGIPAKNKGHAGGRAGFYYSAAKNAARCG